MFFLGPCICSRAMEANVRFREWSGIVSSEFEGMISTQTNQLGVEPKLMVPHLVVGYKGPGALPWKLLRFVLKLIWVFPKIIIIIIIGGTPKSSICEIGFGTIIFTIHFGVYHPLFLVQHPIDCCFHRDLCFCGLCWKHVCKRRRVVMLVHDCSALTLTSKKWVKTTTSPMHLLSTSS